MYEPKSTFNLQHCKPESKSDEYGITDLLLYQSRSELVKMVSLSEAFARAQAPTGHSNQNDNPKGTRLVL